tara:strand:+ start:928 stop:1890 length:963 start_codon:yes stop_codon:yes gene_type:complete
MNTKYILIILGEPYSTFSEIIGKFFINNNKFKKKIIIIGNIKLLKAQLKKLNYLFLLNEIENIGDAKKNIVNIIDVNFSYKKIYSRISNKSNNYLKECFDVALDIIKNNPEKCILINGPISKKTFLKKKYLGITEYLSKKTKAKNETMLIYNNDLSVSPITTHIPIKYVSNNISKKKIKNNVLNIQSFYKKYFNKKIKFAILGLNPHCESIDRISEEQRVIIPTIKQLKKNGISIEGPFSADTFFLKKKLNNYDVVIGMYHDQVLTPIKTLYNFKAINITIGLPFIRISPDHGPNADMLGKNISDPSSFFYAMKFLKKIK